MLKQITWADIYHEYEQPDFPECWRTCANFSNELADGHKAYVMDWYRDVPDLTKPRCVRYEGKPKLIDNLWHLPCKRYEAKRCL